MDKTFRLLKDLNVMSFGKGKVVKNVGSWGREPRRWPFPSLHS